MSGRRCRHPVPPHRDVDPEPIVPATPLTFHFRMRLLTTAEQELERRGRAMGTLRFAGKHYQLRWGTSPAVYEGQVSAEGMIEEDVEDTGRSDAGGTLDVGEM